jgi:chromosome segregation ATPase
MTELSAEQIAEWERLAEEATEGPWRAAEQTHDEWTGIQDNYAALGSMVKHADAAFVVAAREAVPALIARLAEVLRERDAALGREQQVLRALPHDWHAQYRRAEQAEAQLADMTIRADERRIMCDERDALVTKWRERAEQAEAVAAVRTAHRDRLRDEIAPLLRERAEQAEADAAHLQDVVDRENARALQAEAALAAERAKVADVRKALADLGGDNGYGGSQCGVCAGHSPSWDGHSRNCKRAFPDRVRAALDPGATTTAQDEAGGEG